MYMQGPTNSSAEKVLPGIATEAIKDTFTDEKTSRNIDTAAPTEHVQTVMGTPAPRPTWLSAFKHVLPIYIATHVAFLLVTYMATLFAFVPKNFSVYALPLSTL